jgi:hypothetical protein
LFDRHGDACARLLDARDGYGDTALMIAVKGGKHRLAQLLADKQGINVDDGVDIHAANAVAAIEAVVNRPNSEAVHNVANADNDSEIVLSIAAAEAQDALQALTEASTRAQAALQALAAARAAAAAEAEAAAGRLASAMQGALDAAAGAVRGSDVGIGAVRDAERAVAGMQAAIGGGAAGAGVNSGAVGGNGVTGASASAGAGLPQLRASLYSRKRKREGEEEERNLYPRK